MAEADGARPLLVVVSGLPGTGKTTLAVAVAAALRATHLSVDPVEDALLGTGCPPGWTTGVAAYEAVRALAEINLRPGRVVVVDAVGDSLAARATWTRAASATDAAMLDGVLRIDDTAEHRRRLAGRRRPFTHLPEPTWAQVQDLVAGWEPWAADTPRVDLDAGVDTGGNLARLLAAAEELVPGITRA